MRNIPRIPGILKISIFNLLYLFVGAFQIIPALCSTGIEDAISLLTVRM